MSFAFLLKSFEPISDNFYTNTSINSSFENNEYSRSVKKTISQGRYIGGGVTGLFLGFGIGQAIQGRWKERGWIHTVLQAGIIGGFVFGGAFFLDESFSLEKYALYFVIGAFAFLGSKVWETIDTWMLPRSIKVISSDQHSDFYEIQSLYSRYRAKISGMTLQWHF